MKTTIKINNLPVEFTDEVPTSAGVYWYTIAEMAPQLIRIQSGNTGVLYVSGEGSLDGFHGLWSAPLVPVTEVEKAYDEGSNNTEASLGRNAERRWEKSRAKRVVEGMT